jgi:heme exporter protein A
MQAPTAPSLSADSLACRRGDRVLFRGLSLELRAGEALHVTGSNGSGKTTLIRALAGLLEPFAGEVTSNAAIGLLDERPGLDPDLSLGKALSFWERVDQCDDPSAAFTELGLINLLEVPVRYLSTGQRKRAALASLLNREAPIWLLDEPLSGLDHAAIARVTGLVENHVAAGGIALIASHQDLTIPDLKTLAIEDFQP